MDVTFEDNLHKDTWPPIPWFPQLIFRWQFVPKYKGAWRFASCDARGVPQELPFAPLKEATKSSASTLNGAVSA
jgi:hypothetical protein